MDRAPPSKRVVVGSNPTQSVIPPYCKHLSESPSSGLWMKSCKLVFEGVQTHFDAFKEPFFRI